MSDIIQRAKKLFENRYHDEPWLALFDRSRKRFWIETDNFAEVCGDFVSEDDAKLAAAAPELAQALAEETWEHRHEYRAVDDQQWYALTPWAEGEPDRRPWNVTPTRIVRRRVSKPELVNEAD